MTIINLVTPQSQEKVLVNVKFTQLRAGLTSGQICTGYTKDGVGVTFPYSAYVSDPNNITYQELGLEPVITTDTSVLKNSVYLEIGEGVDLPDGSSSSGALTSSLLEALCLHDRTDIGQYLCLKCTALYDVVIGENCTFTSMYYMFSGCTSLIVAPTIPETVTNLQSAFRGCSKLVNPPIIPEGVTNMQSTFSLCYGLVVAPVIPNTVTNMFGTFNSCVSLVTVPNVSTSLTKMQETFYSCNSLVNAPEIPSNVVIMQNTFGLCSSLIVAPTIPASVTDVNGVYDGCRQLQTCKFEHTTSTPMYFYTLRSCDSLTTIYVPSSALSAWQSATGWSAFADKMVGY